jgi:hypothetical protein
MCQRCVVVSKFNWDCQNRTEQLRKLGKLHCCYLDQFNQKESSYATSSICKTALQLEPRRGGSLYPGFVFLGNGQVNWVTLSICIIGFRILIENMPASTLYPSCSVVVLPLRLREGRLPLKLLELPAANTPVARRQSTLAHQSCTPEEICPLPTDPRDLVSAGDRFLLGARLCVMR